MFPYLTLEAEGFLIGSGFLPTPIGCAMTLTNIVFNAADVSTVLASFAASILLGLILFFSGFYGNADIKALIFVGLTIPTVPLTLNPALGMSALPLVLLMFCNLTILSLVWPLAIFILNTKDLLTKRTRMFEGIKLSVRQKFWLLFTARLVPLNKLGDLRYFPAETIVTQEETDKPHRQMLRFVKAETNLKKYTDNLKEHSDLYPNGVLASPTIPTMVFFTVALALVPLVNIAFFIVTLVGVI